MNHAAITLTVHEDATVSIAAGARTIDASRRIVVDNPDAPVPVLDPPLWEGPAEDAGTVLAPGTYIAAIDEVPDVEGAGTTMQDSALATPAELADEYNMSTEQVVAALNDGDLSDDDAVDAVIARSVLDERLHQWRR